MYNQKIFVEKFSETKEFSNTLRNYVIANNQINLNDDMISIYNEYDSNLRKIFKELIKCEETKEYKKCIDSYKNTFDELRSEISKKIEKLSTK